eukprot:CAMPEP_0172303866 /NCGR_PEP_ID=MMETSP1058-20130122/5384_1 /TAXON_ID=83371 /ORGANISM="Detonula confervacea, Strain CCMP 353" /LENGTH=336 /DNA_ID=CAMNT_0013014901 /DNA_START=117 /DNA_END=1127 /DNA_ORIENTATION=+
MTTKTKISHAWLVSYLLLVGSLGTFLIFQRDGRLSSTLASTANLAASAMQIIQTYDFGNAIAVLVAVGGYLLEQWITRTASQLEKQMERVEAQSHQLLIPVTMQWHSLWLGSVVGFIDKHAGEVLFKEENKAELIKYQTIMKDNSNPNHPMLEVPTSLNNPETFAMLLQIMHKPMGKTSTSSRKARVTTKHELPLILHNEILNCDRDSKLWKSYKAFVRYSFVPAVERIAEIIDEHGHLMEPIPSARMQVIFDQDGNGYGQKWNIAPRMWFYSYFLSYAKSWQELLSMWDDGLVDQIRPSVDFPVGIIFFNVEAQSIVAEVEQRLIGASQMHGHRR